MKRVIIIYGMKRSGNHAIINWLKAHDYFFFFNNVIPIDPILRGEKIIPSPEDFNLWLQRRLPQNIFGNCNFKKIEKFAYFLNLKKFALRKHSLIVSLEDHELWVRPFLKADHDVINILILRDPRNMFSSRIRKASLINNLAYPNHSGPLMDRVLELWKIYAREYLGLTNYLENKLCIYFNSWFSDQNYRQSISQNLNIEFNDSGFSQVSRTGLGSSFDGVQYSGESQNMRVLTREKFLNDSERQLLEAVLADDELQNLTDRITATSRVGV
ncbi:MAG: hypothetical protein F6K19_02185 [Cyanothece sp. SIO1E1]|nr:hypothetical protein [Cyanothece sp. SIO1E1]